VSLLVDLFGYLSIVLHGLTIVAQSVALGSVLFIALLAQPLAPRLGAAGPGIERGAARIAAWSAIGLLLAEGLALALQTAVLVDTVDLSVPDVLGANFAIAGLVRIAASGLIALLLFARLRHPPIYPLLGLAAIVVVAATFTTHAAARLDNRAPLLLVEFLHQSGAAVWIGGLPCFLLALARVGGGEAAGVVGERYSRMSMAGVACILVSGIVMAAFYVGDVPGLYGTAYGVMVGGKVAMFLMLLGLGAGNFLLIRQLRTDPATPIIRLRRFAEVEFGIGIAIFFAAASLTSVPPAVDLQQDRVTWQDIVERNTPQWPRLTPPDHDTLALPALQAKLDAEAAAEGGSRQWAFVPGSGEIPPRNAADIAWSENNHHWAGLLVAAVGILALLNRAGLRWARHWPLLFLLLGGFLFLRSDPETWPAGKIPLWDSLRDVEVLQHKALVLLVVVLAAIEWRVRATRWNNRVAVLVFPLLCAAGGTLLLTHSHAIANIKEQLLIEVTHTPLALAGVVAGWARWLELRLDPDVNPVAIRVAGWIWPACILFCGLVLLDYRES
jgi:putative copper resistance protein D